MSNAASQLAPQFPRLTIAQRSIPNPNHFQIYVLYGTEPGPWAKVGFNDVEYMIGFLPTHQKPKRRPSQN